MMLWKSAFIGCISLITFAQVNAQPKPNGNPSLFALADGTSFSRAQWSPDGNKLLFTGLNNTGIYIQDKSATSFDKINNDPGVGFGANWISDDAILIRHTIQEGMSSKHAVALLTLDGSLSPKTDYIHSMPSVPTLSSDKNKIYYLNKSHVSSIASGLVLKNSGSESSNDFISVSNKLIQTKSSSSGIQTQSLSEFEGDLINVVYSKDGNRIAFEVVGGSTHIFDVPTGQFYDLGRYNRPSFSPDGNYIVAMKATDDGYNVISSDLVAVRFDGSETVVLLHNPNLRAMNPAWSPSGNAIAFDSPDTGSIYLLPITY